MAADAARPTTWWRVVAAGAALGLTWAVAARAWMRYVSDEPEFTWSGTGFILGVGVVAGTCLGVVEWARRSGRSRAWKVVGVGSLGVFGGAGSILLPMALAGAVGLSGRLRARWSALLLALATVATFAVVVADDVPHDVVASALGLLLVVGCLAAGLSVLVRRWGPPVLRDADGEPVIPPGARVPRPRRARSGSRRAQEPSR